MKTLGRLGDADLLTDKQPVTQKSEILLTS
jgi:hypothetical protein